MGASHSPASAGPNTGCSKTGRDVSEALYSSVRTRLHENHVALPPRAGTRQEAPRAARAGRGGAVGRAVAAAALPGQFVWRCGDKVVPRRQRAPPHVSVVVAVRLTPLAAADALSRPKAAVQCTLGPAGPRARPCIEMETERPRPGQVRNAWPRFIGIGGMPWGPPPSHRRATVGRGRPRPRSRGRPSLPCSARPPRSVTCREPHRRLSYGVLDHCAGCDKRPALLLPPLGRARREGGDKLPQRPQRGGGLRRAPGG